MTCTCFRCDSHRFWLSEEPPPHPPLAPTYTPLRSRAEYLRRRDPDNEADMDADLAWTRQQRRW
jgi:hypothetical protein